MTAYKYAIHPITLIGIGVLVVVASPFLADRWRKSTVFYMGKPPRNEIQRIRLPKKNLSGPRDAVASVRRRRLSSQFDDAFWPQRNGWACRTASGDDGQNGYEYRHYIGKSLEWCKERCINNDECRAFEFKVEGNYRKCEIWYQLPELFLEKDGYWCWTKTESDDNDNDTGSGGDNEDTGGGEGNDNNSLEYTQMRDHACRTANNGNGSPGDEFVRYTNKSFEWCVSKCNSEVDCLGFEFKGQGTEHCEIWKDTPTRFQPSDGGHHCYVKNEDPSTGNREYEIGSEPGTEPDPAPVPEYEEMENKACRTASGAKGSSGQQYIKYSPASFDWCIEKCNSQADCKGFEFKKTATMHCEIWTEPPERFDDADNMSCFVKL